MFKVPEKYRITTHSPFASDASYGNNGAFKIPLETGVLAQVIASDGAGWEHVSVVIIEDGKIETPTWEEMCKIKDVFWGDDDTVVQFHPPKSEYVNNHPNCLHLWRSIKDQIKLPDSLLVGIKH